MTTKTDHSFAQFDAFLNSAVPDEYKDLLKSFQKQGDFYQQFIQCANEQQPDLSEFWSLPNTLGFDSLSNHQLKWLQSVFDLTNLSAPSSDPLNKQPSDLLKNLPTQVQKNLKAIQSALAKMSILYNELTQLAMQRFQVLNNQAKNPTPEQLCAQWLEAGEEAFSEINQTEEYIQAHKGLIESLGELQNIQHTLSEQASELLGLPSKESIHDLRKSLHKLRIEFAEYKEQTDTKLDELAQTIRKLK